MSGYLFSKAEVPGSSLLDHLPKEFSLRLTRCPWLVNIMAPEGLVEVRVSWSEHPHYLKKISDNLKGFQLMTIVY